MNKQIVLGKYPELKLGFTTANFSKVLPLAPVNIKKMLDFASEQSFVFIEIRDPHAKLTLEECKDLSFYANQKGIEVVYAMGCGLLDTNYWEIFSRGIANASAFTGLKVVRTGTTGVEMLNDGKKKYWTSTEFSTLIQTANLAGNTAKMFGLQFLVENAREGFQGDGITTFGTTEFFGSKGVNENVGLQLDVANFFCTSRAPGEPTDVNAFVAANVEKVSYTHLKTSKDHKPMKILDGNELPFEIFFDLLQKNGKNYIVIELDQAVTLADSYANHLKSIEYLKNNY